jgi:Uncharacterized protein conserved in bacteria (DUF2219)
VRKRGVRVRIIIGALLALAAGQAAEAQAHFAGAAVRGGTDSRVASALNAAAFAKPATHNPLLTGASVKNERALDMVAADLSEGPFAVPLATSSDDRSLSLLDGARYDSGMGLTSRWDAQQFNLAPGRGGAVDSVRLSVSSQALIPGLGPRDLAAERFQPDAFDVTLTRGWPQAVQFDAGQFNIDVSPHAGLGYGNTGGSAEAGAVVRVGQGLEDKMADKLTGGVMDGKAFGNRDRWYLFAAASGRAVGLNMLSQDGGWNRAGWSQDQTSSLVGDAQLGVGFRRGAMQTSFGYVHRTIKSKEAIMGMDSKDDSVIAFSFSLRPQQ